MTVSVAATLRMDKLLCFLFLPVSLLIPAPQNLYRNKNEDESQ